MKKYFKKDEINETLNYLNILLDGLFSDEKGRFSNYLLKLPENKIEIHYFHHLLYEILLFSVLKKRENVKRVELEKMFKDEESVWHADVFVKYKDGSSEVIEVKTSKLLKRIVEGKLKKMKRYCPNSSYSFASPLLSEYNSDLVHRQYKLPPLNALRKFLRKLKENKKASEEIWKKLEAELEAEMF